MITIEESNELIRFLTSEINEVCWNKISGKKYDSNILEYVLEKCRLKYRVDINPNVIIYFISNIVTEDMKCPVSYIFRNACMYGCDSDSIYNNTSIISENEFISYIMDVYYMGVSYNDEFGISNTITYIVMEVPMNYLNYVYDNIDIRAASGKYMSSMYDLNDFIKDVNTFKNICDVISDVYEHIRDNRIFYMVDQPDTSVIVDILIDKMFSNQKDDETLKFVNSSIETLVNDLIIPIILDGYADITDGLLSISQQSGIISISEDILYFNNMIKILDLFAGIYSSFDSHAVINMMLYELIHASINLIITVVDAIEVHYTGYDKMDVLKSVYSSLYNNIIIPGLKGEWKPIELS